MRPTETQPLQIISQDATGSGGLSEAVEVLKSVGPATDPSAVRFGYVVKTVNRTTATEPAFEARYLVLGTKPPEVDVRICKPGLELRDFSFESLSSRRSWLDYIADFAFPLGMLVLYIPLILFSRKYARRKLAKGDEKLREVFHEAIKNANAVAGISGSQGGPPDADYILAAFQRHRWESSPRFVRWLGGVPEPPQLQRQLSHN